VTLQPEVSVALCPAGLGPRFPLSFFFPLPPFSLLEKAAAIVGSLLPARRGSATEKSEKARQSQTGLSLSFFFSECGSLLENGCH